MSDHEPWSPFRVFVTGLAAVIGCVLFAALSYGLVFFVGSTMGILPALAVAGIIIAFIGALAIYVLGMIIEYAVRVKDD